MVANLCRMVPVIALYIIVGCERVEVVQPEAADCRITYDSSTALPVGSSDTASHNVWFGSIDRALITSSGTIIVIDRLRGLIHGLTAGAEYEWNAGGSGSGPGEFRFIDWADEWRDTVAVFDRRLRRVTLLNGNAQLLQTFSAPAVEGLFSIAGRLSDGSVLYRASVGRTRSRVGAFSDTVHLTLRSLHTNVSHDLGYYVGTQRYMDHSHGFSVWLAPFGRRPTFAARGSHVVIALAAEADVTVVDSTLSFRTLRVDDSSRAIRADHIDTFAAEELQATNSPNASRAMLRSVEFPERTPPYGHVVLDREQRLWIERYPLPGDVTRSYHVVTLDGHDMGVIELPGSWEILDADSDHLVAKASAADGEPLLVIQPIACFSS
jgi:hypothetical protein